MTTRLATALRLLLLGADPRQQIRAQHSLTVLGIYLVFAGVQHLEVVLGLIPAEQSWPLTAWNLTGGLGFYLAIRSGFNLRIATGRARALTLPQQLWAVTGIAWSYAITGPARGAVMLIMLLVLIYGVFSLDARQARRLVGTAFVMLGSAMVWKAWTDPVFYDPRVEGMHLLFAGIVMAAVSSLAVRLGRLRERLEQQRTELATALARIQRLATHDELTGLKNRRAALERMREELATRSSDRPLLSLALLDLDHFKQVNDTLGHAAGDAVLRRFAECSREVLRNADQLARWGGEEFLLMLPATRAGDAMEALARLRLTLQAGRFEDIAPGLVVSFSAGVAECRAEADLEAAIERADAAMYRAKQSGRDRALLADAGAPVDAAQSAV